MLIVSKGNKIRITMLLCILMVMSSISTISAVGQEQKIEIHTYDFDFTVDDQTYRAPSDTKGFIYNNRTYVPLRFASYILEKWVEWDSKTQSVIVSEPTNVQLKQLQAFKKQYLSPITNSANSTFEKATILAYQNYGQFVFFGKQESIPDDTTTILYDGTIYVPIRFFAEVIDKQVAYDAKTKKIMMATKTNTSIDGSSNPKGEDVQELEEGKVIEGSDKNSSTKPSRESLVSQTQAKLESLESSAISKAYSLYEQYTKTTDEEKKSALLAQGLSMLEETENKVEQLLAELDSNLEKYGYEVGSDSNEFRDTYTKKKESLYAKFI